MAFGFLQKREKRRWLFRKSSSGHPEAKPKPETFVTVDPIIVNEQRHAIAVAAATAAAAEAVVATAQAAMKIAQFTPPVPTFIKENWAAVIIQTAFRGYLVCPERSKGKQFQVLLKSFLSGNANDCT